MVPFDRIQTKAPARQGRGFDVADWAIELNSNGLPAASGDPRASGPIAAHSSRRNHNSRGHRRSAVRPNPSRDANRHASRHASRPRRRRRSVPARPHPAKLRQLQQARVCVTWSSPQGSARSAPSVTSQPLRPLNRRGVRSIKTYARGGERKPDIHFREGSSS